MKVEYQVIRYGGDFRFVILSNNAEALFVFGSAFRLNPG